MDIEEERTRETYQLAYWSFGSVLLIHSPEKVDVSAEQLLSKLNKINKIV